MISKTFLNQLKYAEFEVTGLCVEISQMTGEFPAIPLTKGQ